MIHWVASLSRAQRGGIAYGLLLGFWLFVMELPGHFFSWWPIPTLTTDVRDAIRWWHPIGLMLIFFFFVLWAHFDLGWTAAYLIAAAVLILAAVTVHALI
jgi:hypothetical protein